VTVAGSTSGAAFGTVDRVVLSLVSSHAVLHMPATGTSARWLNQPTTKATG
jgi:hypothetical protein